MIPMQDLVERVLTDSTADGCIVVGSEHTETNLRWAANNLTTNGQMASRSVTVISILNEAAGPSAGVVTRSVTSADEVPDLVAASELAARKAGPADDAAPLVQPYETDDDWSADPARTSVAVFGRFAAGLGAAFAVASRRDRLLFGFAEHSLTSTFVASSTGLRRRFDQPTGRVELNAKSADYRRSVWNGVHTRDFTDVDIGALTEGLNIRLDWAATTHELPPGRYETILPPTAVADLMLDAYWTASARDAEEGRSVYARGGGDTRIGERLSELPLTLRSDPNEPGLRCAPFEIATASAAGLQSVFDNGAPVEACSWIANGELSELIRTRSWAGRTSAAPRLFVDNLILDGDGTAGLEEMIANTERGLLLTSLWYIREVDPQTLLLTGLTRDGVYLVENGTVQGAVNNFRFNESPVALLGRITEIGRTVPTLPREWSDYFTRAAMPPVRVPDFNMSTVSQAS
jgi:predicted Zn-dependent protease